MITMKPFFGYLAEHKITLKQASRVMKIKPQALYQARLKNSFSQNMIEKACAGFGLNVEEVIRYDED